MKHLTHLCLTVCSLALLSGCDNTDDLDELDNQTTESSQPSTQSPSSNLNELLKPDTPLAPASGQADKQPLKANVYIYNSLLPKPPTQVSLTDSAYFMTLTTYLLWKENQTLLNIKGLIPHSVKVTEKLSKMPDAESGSIVFVDAWGDSPQNKADFTLDSSAIFSAMDLLDADLSILNRGNPTTLALRLENAVISIAPNAKLNTHALYVDEKSIIKYGQNITYVSNNVDQFGLTMNQLNVQKNKRFPWATEAEFMVAGQVDHLKVTPGLTLYTKGNVAKFTTVEHQGGTIKLISSAPFTTNTYDVNTSEGLINVVWDASSTRPLMQTDSAKISSSVSVKVSELNQGIQTGDTLVLIECKGNELTSFKPINKTTLAAVFDLSTSKDETTNVSRLILTLAKKGLVATGLSHTETSIAHQILNLDEKQGKLSMALLDTATAEKGLHDITQGAYLSAIRPTPLSFDGLRDGTAYTSDAGIIQGHNETGFETLTTTGVNLSSNVRFGFSVIQPAIAPQTPQSNIGAIHGQYKHFGVDAFSSLDGNLNGGNLGVYLGNTLDGYAAISVSTQHQVRHGSTHTVFGDLSVNALNETHVFCNATLKKKVKNVDVSAQFFTEIYAARAAYIARLNSANLSIPSAMLPLTYGVHVQTTYFYDGGYISAGCGLSDDTYGVSPNVSFQMNLSL